MDEKISMPLLGDAFPELNVQTTHGPMSLPKDMMHTSSRAMR